MADNNLIDDLDAEEKALNDRKKIIEVKKKILGSINTYDNENFTLFNSYKETLDKYHNLQNEIKDYLASIINDITTIEMADKVNEMITRLNKAPAHFDNAYSTAERILSYPGLINELQRRNITGVLHQIISPVSKYISELNHNLEYECADLKHDFNEFKLQINSGLHHNK